MSVPWRGAGGQSAAPAGVGGAPPWHAPASDEAPASHHRRGRGPLLDLLATVLGMDGGLEVVGAFGGAEAALRDVPSLKPDVALLDIELGGGINGVQLGLLLREKLPGLGIVPLSNVRAPRLLPSIPRPQVSGWSYLLKRSVRDASVLRRAVDGASQGLVALDPSLVAGRQARDAGALAGLTERQRGILALVAEGLTNDAIAAPGDRAEDGGGPARPDLTGARPRPGARPRAPAREGRAIPPSASSMDRCGARRSALGSALRAMPSRVDTPGAVSMRTSRSADEPASISSAGTRPTSMSGDSAGGSRRGRPPRAGGRARRRRSAPAGAGARPSGTRARRRPRRR